MGLFDSFRGRSAEVKLDVQKALMTVIVSAVKADGRIEDDEILQLRSICAWSPVFSSNSSDQDRSLIIFADNFTDDAGLEEAVRKAAGSLSRPLRETAFCFATRIALADGYLGELLIPLVPGPRYVVTG